MGIKTRVVNLKLDKYEIYIGRGSIWGNPFVMGKDGTRDSVIAKYRYQLMQALKQGSITNDDLINLRGKVLGCYCKPLKCHGDVLAEFAEQAYLENEKRV